MAKITAEDLRKVREPCKSCNIYAIGRGKDKEIYCTASCAKLMGEGNPFWFEIPDCPEKRTKSPR